MGGIYYYLWSCNKCNFTDKTISAPFNIEAKKGIYKALIEHRYCYDCDGIRICFTGKGHIYNLSDLEDSKFNDLIFQSNLDSREEIILIINELNSKKINNQSFAFSKENELSLLKQALNKCDEQTAKAKSFYEKLNSKPRCLICGTINISQFDWGVDKHFCGGNFIQNLSGRMETVESFDKIIYDEYGMPNYINNNIIN
jgi:hypothetical protein